MARPMRQESSTSSSLESDASDLHDLHVRVCSITTSYGSNPTPEKRPGSIVTHQRKSRKSIVDKSLGVIVVS